MSTNGINEIFKSGHTVKLQNRGAKSGITFELKSVFDQMAKEGLIKDTNDDGLTRNDAMSLFNKLDALQREKKYSTNYTKMQVGQEFEYSADDMKVLAKAAGYEIIEQRSDNQGAKQEIEQPILQPNEQKKDVVTTVDQDKNGKKSTEKGYRQEVNMSYAEDMRQPWTPVKAEAPVPVPQKNQEPVIEEGADDKIVIQNDNQTVQSPVVVEVTEDELPVKPNKIDMQGASGSYLIKETENGGYEVNSQIRLTYENPIKSKLDLLRTDYSKDKNGVQYIAKKAGFTVRCSSKAICQQRLSLKTDRFASEHVIYLDLLSKQKSGQTLTRAEQKFVSYHLEQMKNSGIKFDKDGNIADN